jgi:hypothetical protein
VSTQDPLQLSTQPVPHTPLLQVARWALPGSGAAQGVQLVPQLVTASSGTHWSLQTCQPELQA